MKIYKNNIRKYRNKKFISQSKLAKEAKISQSYLSAIEREEKSPTLRMLYRISKELKVCPKLLFSCNKSCEECSNNKEYKL